MAIHQQISSSSLLDLRNCVFDLKSPIVFSSFSLCSIEMTMAANGDVVLGIGAGDYVKLTEGGVGDGDTVEPCRWSAMFDYCCRCDCCFYHLDGPLFMDKLLKWEEVQLEEPKEGEIRLMNEAVGVNFINIYFRKGVYKAPTTPFTPVTADSNAPVEIKLNKSLGFNIP